MQEMDRKLIFGKIHAFYVLNLIFLRWVTGVPPND
jgi:hypothetical protein